MTSEQNQNQKALQVGVLLPPQSLNPVNPKNPVSLWGRGDRVTPCHDKAGDSQKRDPVIGPVLYFRSQNQKPCRSETGGGGRQVCLLLKDWKRLKVKDGIMYHCIQDCQRGALEQLLLPESLRTSVKTALHDDSGHLGFEKTLQMIRERFYWPRMFQEIKPWCEQCEKCCLRKTPTAGLRAPLVSIHSSTLMELVYVDFLTLEKSKGGIEMC